MCVIADAARGVAIASHARRQVRDTKPTAERRWFDDSRTPHTRSAWHYGTGSQLDRFERGAALENASSSRRCAQLISSAAKRSNLRRRDVCRTRVSPGDRMTPAMATPRARLRLRTFGGQRALDAVKCAHFFSRTRAPHDDAPLAEQIHVKGMER